MDNKQIGVNEIFNIYKKYLRNILDDFIIYAVGETYESNNKYETIFNLL